MSDETEFRMTPRYPREIEKTCPKCGSVREKHKGGLESCTDCNWYIMPKGKGRDPTDEERLNELERKIDKIQTRLRALEQCFNND